MRFQPILFVMSIFLFHIGMLQGQCDEFNFYTQSDVDSFALKHDSCLHLESVYLWACDSCNIVDLDGLGKVESIGRLTIESNTLITLSGLTSLQYVDELNFESQARINDAFPVLDSIDELNHVFHDSDQDLDIYRNVSHIRELDLIGNGNFTGLDAFVPHSHFEVLIAENESGVSIEPLLNNYMEHIMRISLDRSALDISSLSSLKSLGVLSFVNCLSMDVSPILNISHLDYFSYNAADGMELDFGNGFLNVDTLKGLSMSDTKIRNLESLFRNLKAIRYQLRLRDNPLLESIDLVSNFPEIERGNLPKYSRDYIEISNNRRLETCSNPFICNAVKTIPSPDSLAIFNNGKYCDYDSLNVVGCLTVNSSKVVDSNFLLYPNPAADQINMKTDYTGQINYRLSSIDGRCAREGELHNNSVDVSQIEEGVYILNILTESGAHSEKVVISR